ncbi:MAG TPA: adenylate/guanylate cyclase domain-containing protein [Bryobacteraceae bacterium]|nr:adenylate/guanylate cyclase domain-containing protein [Bryobacteraceae bacterium]
MLGSGFPYLVVPDAGGEREFPLMSGYMWRIGRNDACDIALASKRVSRDHAIIQRDDSGDYYLIDMGSQNGSFVNDRRVSTPALLRDGDRVSIGGFVFTFHWPGGGSDPASSVMAETAATEACFQRQFLTVLVVDIRDFTRLTQRTEQSVLSEAIGTWFRHASEIMKRHGTWALKYIGDAIMSTWLHSEPGAASRDLAQILQALVEFAEATSALEADFQLPAPIRIGAGINTGYASVGNTGTRTFTDYTALGDAVNAAFRIESATKDIGADVVIGASTFEALHFSPVREHHFQPHDARLKGYDAPVRVWAASLEGIKAFLDESPKPS